MEYLKTYLKLIILKDLFTLAILTKTLKKKKIEMQNISFEKKALPNIRLALQAVEIYQFQTKGFVVRLIYLFKYLTLLKNNLE